MLKNYLKISIRSILRNKAYSTINVIGLSVGIAFTLLILLWINDELGYDRFHSNEEEIYRIVGDDAIVGKMSVTCGPLAGYLKDNFPEIVNTTRYMPYNGSVFKYNNKLLKIEKGAFADPAFFEIFSFDFITGDPKTALSNLTDIVITESTSKRFFGDENALGKTLLVDGQNPAIVTAVIKDVPANSQLQFDFVINTEILKYIGFPIESWSNAGLNTFIQVKQNADINNLNKNIADIMPEKVQGFNRKLFLQPLTEIHLNTEYSYDLPGLGDIKYIYIFSAIVLFLIIIASINYINLATAKVLKRSKEVGIRKIMGSNRMQIMKQYLTESIIIVSLSFIIALILIEVLLPAFNQISGKFISLNYLDTTIITVLITLLLTITMLSGAYPAFLISSIRPVHSLKNMFRDGHRGSSIRKGLVVVQFAFSIILIAGTATVYQQLNFIKNKKLGFDKENIIYLTAQGKFQQNYNTIKTELLKQSSITDVTAEDKLFTDSYQSTTSLDWEGKEVNTDINIGYSYVDYNFFDMLDVKLKEGRNFSESMSTDEKAFILNEEAVNMMKIKQPLGKRFVLNNIQGKIIGVITNTNFRSLHHRVQPNAYMLITDYSELSFKYNGIVYLKIAAGKTGEAISAIESIWKKENPNLPFEYHFLDVTIDKQYVKETQTGKIFSWFSLVAILISCLGLYGLTMFTVENRVKEIGLRKVLGASIPGILKLFYNDFTKLIILSSIIACPVAWYAINEWFQNFAYRIDISWWIFALAGGIALLIALVTVSFQAIKAATANPVESLRSE